jgi:hypothetical protein
VGDAVALTLGQQRGHRVHVSAGRVQQVVDAIANRVGHGRPPGVIIGDTIT